MRSGGGGEMLQFRPASDASEYLDFFFSENCQKISFLEIVFINTSQCLSVKI